MREARTITRYRPIQASARHASGSGSIWETPFHASMDAAARATGCPSGPVRYVIRFAATPLYANLSAISIAAAVIQGKIRNKTTPLSRQRVSNARTVKTSRSGTYP